MELRDAGIRMWIFNRDSPPGDLRPSTYGNGTDGTVDGRHLSFRLPMDQFNIGNMLTIPYSRQRHHP